MTAKEDAEARKRMKKADQMRQALTSTSTASKVLKSITKGS